MSNVVQLETLEEAAHRKYYQASAGKYLVTGRNPSEDEPDRRSNGHNTLEGAKEIAKLLAENDNERIWHVSDDTGTWLYTVDTGMLQPVYPR